MIRRAIIAVLLIAIIVLAGIWVASHWAYYAGMLAVLWPLLVGLLVVLATVLEGVWWLRFDDWYYRTGPRTRCEQWQTCGREGEVRDSIRPILGSEGWAGRESAAGFCIRRRSFRKHFGSRVFLRLEDTDQGTAVRYEIRPMWTAPLWLAAAAALFFSRFGVLFFTPPFAWFLAPWGCLVAVWALGYYLWSAPRETDRLARVKHVRAALAAYRLGVCEGCGYDLFGHAEKSVCPECGAEAGGRPFPAGHKDQGTPEGEG